MAIVSLFCFISSFSPQSNPFLKLVWSNCCSLHRKSYTPWHLTTQGVYTAPFIVSQSHNIKTFLRSKESRIPTLYTQMATLRFVAIT